MEAEKIEAVLWNWQDICYIFFHLGVHCKVQMLYIPKCSVSLITIVVFNLKIVYSVYISFF